MRAEIIDLMSDGYPRTSYEICDALYGPQKNGRRWFIVSGECDRLATRGLFRVLGKLDHRTVYQARRQ